MITARVIQGTALTVCMSLVAVSAAAQATATQKPFEPRVGQEGKDVVWVPTPQETVDKMLELAQITPQDVLLDLGSGDGITVITAAKRGVRGHGVEYNPDMVELAKQRAAEAGVSDRATFVKEDLFETDLTKATVITMFLLPRINMELRPRLLDLKPGTRVVSNTFTMEDWEADETASTPDCTSWCTALLWIVPAKVEGTWQTEQGQLILDQQFQMVTGSLGGRALSEGRLRGAEISFNVGNARYTGKVNGERITGSISGGNGRTWTATRTGK
ncbi:class I SAM-dependent methyltransferase [soil metagenome]|nr:methyltransferase domain-containing protein [Acidobacteriota bacterium]